MSQNNNPSTKIKKFELNYDKRRYDGGTEINLIEYIEAKRKAAEKAREAAQSQPQVHTNPQAAAPPVNPNLSAGKPITKGQILGQSLLVGPLEIAVAVAGVFTSVLALMAFTFYKNDVLRQQAKFILKESGKMMKKGLWDCVAAPVKGVKHVLTHAG